MLYGALAGADEQRRRAMLETALELLPASRHKQVIRGMLARQAVRHRDLQAAEEWLAPCDPYADDIHMDTAYRFSKAYLATAQQQWQEVLQFVGYRTGDVPIADGSDHAVAVLRANAHERQGQLPTAVQQLTELAATGAGLGLLEKIVAANPELALCPHSLAQVRMQMGASAQAAAKSGGGFGCLGIIPWLIIPVGFFVAAFVVPSGSTTDDGFPLTYFMLFMGACFMLGPAIMVLVRVSSSRRAAHFARVGVDGTAQILSVRETGVRVNHQPQVAIQMRVFAGNMPPYEVTTNKVVSVVDLPRMQPGASMSVKVDPGKPHDVQFG